MRLVFLGRVLGELDVEQRVLIDLTLLVLLTLEHSEVNAFQGDYHVQTGHASMEGVGYQQSWIEMVQRAGQDDVAEALTTEEGKTYLAGDKCLINTFAVALLDGDFCAFKQTISCVSGLFLPSSRCWLAVRLWLFFGKNRGGGCCNSLMFLSLNRWGFLLGWFGLRFLCLGVFYFYFISLLFFLLGFLHLGFLHLGFLSGICFHTYLMFIWIIKLTTCTNMRRLYLQEQSGGGMDMGIELMVLIVNYFNNINLMLKNKENLQSQTWGDRFIPSEIRSCAFQVEYKTPCRESATSNYEQLLNKGILDDIDLKANHKIMSFNKPHQNSAPRHAPSQHPLARLDHTNGRTRKISKKPYKILDAPNLQDDFYLNLLDWSDKNQIAVALDSSLYLWSGCSSEITRLYQTSQVNDYICSVSFCDDNRIAIGNSSGQIKVFDIAKRKKVANFQGHYGRVGSLDWANGLLASGSRDGAVASWDIRSGLINRYKAHTQQICGLKWSPQGSYIASGGNDNKLVVYSQKGNSELVKFHEHKAAVKAIGWCPNNPGTLASGGGTADRHIRFFSTHSLAQNFSIDTGSQICNLVFSKISNEMITTHGYSLNQINLWSSSCNWEEKSVSKVATLTGHTYRVLYLAMSPNGQSILTGAGDETLRFWNVFDSSHYKKHETLSFQMDLR